MLIEFKGYTFSKSEIQAFGYDEFYADVYDCRDGHKTKVVEIYLKGKEKPIKISITGDSDFQDFKKKFEAIT